MSKSEKIFNFTRPPVLLIGAGISKRYLKDYLGWEDLLRLVAERIGIDNNTYLAYLAGATDSENYVDLPTVASEIKDQLIKRIKNGQLNPSTLYTEKELELYNGKIDPFKIIVASLCKNENIKNDVELLEELDSFKKLKSIIPGIITTNYDRFLEKNIFTDFKVYSDVSDYYFTDSEGIGEIYKIHGTANMPNSIIITNNDYEMFDKKSKLVTSKILSMMCDYPLVILGYSLDDDNVKKMINDLMSSLDKTKIQEIEKNIIYVEYLEGESDIKRKSGYFDYEGKRMSISTICTDNFKGIFDEVGTMTPSMSPLAIRKARQMVRKIVLSEDCSNHISFIGIDRIDDISADKIVIAFADKETMLRMKRYHLNF